MKNKLNGIQVICSELNFAPSSAGVYRMLGKNNSVLYVGKAKNLKKRLTSYTKPEAMTNRIQRMLFETKKLVLIETNTEDEALLLEISLIKSLKPKYNIIFKDDTSYLSILITDDKIPMITTHRGKQKVKGSLFGPYPKGSAVYKTLDILEQVFHLRTCKNNIFKNRSRPCLKYHIKRCSAPCVNKISAENYQSLVNQACAFLSGKTQQLQKKLQSTMEKASANMNFEEAAIYRDRLQALNALTSSNIVASNSIINGDIIGLYTKNNKVCIQIFYYRFGNHVGNHAFFPKGVEGCTANEIMRIFIATYYNTHIPPNEIYVSHNPSEVELLKLIIKTKIIQPKRGAKFKLMNDVIKNAASNLERKNVQNISWQKNMVSFANLLNINSINHLEAFDISNISGTQAVASMVVADGSGMVKSQYRKFSIKNKNTPDDYAMMEEVLKRRYTKNNISYPDVIMVDGGKGHLNILIKVFKDITIEENKTPILCAIAKGKDRNKGNETIWLANKNKPLNIPFNSSLIFMLQHIRDESHRFAITFHRQKRAKNISKSALDDIPTIGQKRKKMLLLAFGSINRVKEASIEQLKMVEGISTALAEQIYNYLR